MICRWYDTRTTFKSETPLFEFSYIDCATHAWCLEHTGRPLDALQVIKTGLSRQSSDSNADGTVADGTSNEVAASQRDNVLQPEAGTVSGEQVLLTAHLYLLAKATNDQQQSASALASLYQLLNVPVDDKTRLLEAFNLVEDFPHIRELLSARITQLLQ